MITRRINNNSTIFNSYIQLPCSILKYNISAEAMIIYSLMLRRANYIDDKVNRYVDTNDDVYITYTVKALQVALHSSLSERTIINAIKELEANSLLDTIKIQGKKTCYYVRQVIEDTKKGESSKKEDTPRNSLNDNKLYELNQEEKNYNVVDFRTQEKPLQKMQHFENDKQEEQKSNKQENLEKTKENNPSIIKIEEGKNYCKNYTTSDDNHCKNYSRTTAKITVQPLQKMQHNINNIYKYNNKSSINQIYKLGKYENIELTQEEKETLIERYGDNFNKLIEKASEKIHSRKDPKPITSYYSYLTKLAETFDLKTVNEIDEAKRRRKEHKIKMITHLAITEGIKPSEDEKEILGEEEYYKLREIARQRYYEINNVKEPGKINSLEDMINALPESIKTELTKRRNKRKDI